MNLVEDSVGIDVDTAHELGTQRKVRKSLSKDEALYMRA